jgi:histidine decarboxylase
VTPAGAAAAGGATTAAWARGGRSDPGPTLARLLAAAKRARRHDIGFPGATDLTFPELSEWLTGQLLNNVGDPADPGHGRNHTKDLERQVIDMIADLLHAPPGRWGYVTGGASEGTEHALDEAWQSWSDVVVYTSAAAHYSVAKAARRLKLPLVQVRTLVDGQMDLEDLAGELRLRRHLPAMVVATAGTTMTEAVDDVAGIVKVCDELAVSRRRVHVDAALSGVPLALLPDDVRPAFDFAAGATSMVISGHKFLSSLMPCGVLIHAASPYLRDRRVAYTGSVDTTITGSRSGHTPLILWTALTRLGVDGHRLRAENARAMAAYTYSRLTAIGWPAWRNPYGFTVVLDTPPPAVLDTWVLADDGHRAHVITMPGVTRDQIDEFVADLQAATTTRPRQRRRRALSTVGAGKDVPA